MPRYEILHGQFCALSKEDDFQKWLQSVSVNLYNVLMNHLKHETGCKSNVAKMLEIQKALQDQGHIAKLVDFLRTRYPFAIERLDDAPSITGKPTMFKTKSTTSTSYLKSIDETEVFKYYNPNLLTFPMKAILMNDDVDQLRKDVKKFIADKISTDYIIIGNKAYIEYFKPKHELESTLIPKNSREIFQYRIRHSKLQMEKT